MDLGLGLKAIGQIILCYLRLIPDPIERSATVLGDWIWDQTKASAHMWRYHVKYRVAGLIPDPMCRSIK